MEVESNFPRGNIKSAKRKAPTNVTDNLFSFSIVNKKKEILKSRKRKRSVSPRPSAKLPSEELYATSANIITFDQVQEGMLMLACVRNITTFAVEVELPGRTSGKIYINSISESYTKLLQKTVEENNTEEKDLSKLDNIFKVGQFIPVKVLEKKHCDKGIKLVLSTNPLDIYVDWNHRGFSCKFLVWTAVESELDHGYQLSTGIRNCRTFLPNENVEKGTSFVVGQPLWCVVQKCDINFAASTYTVSTLEKHMAKAMQNVDVDLHHVIPGMKVDFTITNIVKLGLQGQFFNNYCGYINESYLTNPRHKLSKYKEGQTVKAHLLYLQSITKFAYFSLRSLQCAAPPTLAKGTILRAKIIGKMDGGLKISLSDDKRGFVSFKRIAKVLHKTNDLKNAINKKYSNGSSHQCRVLDYNQFEQIYICTFEPATLNEKIFTMDDVKIGELVKVKVDSITKAGLVVTMGKIKGFIQNSHLSDVLYSENIKNKFSEGQTLQARIWSVDSRGVYLTHKQAFVKSDVCLSSLNDAVVGEQYPGMVVNKSHKNMLVIFYGALRGLLQKYDLEEMYGDNVEETFYEGQVILTAVKKIGDNFLYLTLNPSTPKGSVLLSVGKYYNAVVAKINEDSLEIEVDNDKVPARVPMAHLSCCLPLTPALLNTYSSGDVLEDLICLNNKNVPILSLREGKEYKRKKFKIPINNEIKVGSLIRCSYVASYNSSIVVSTPLIPYNRKLKIANKELEAEQSNFNYQQAIVAKVKSLNKNNGNIEVTTKLSELFSLNYNDGLDYLQEYLENTIRIRKHSKLPLAKLRVGQRVQCVVNNVNDLGCSVFLKNNVQGLVSKVHCPENIQSGQKLNGVILWVNFENYYVDLSLKGDIIEKVDKVQGGAIDKPMNSAIHAEILVVDSDYVVAISVNKRMNKQLIFLPNNFYVNSCTKMVMYDVLQKIEIVIAKQIEGYIIGFDKTRAKQLANIKSGAKNLKESCFTKEATEKNLQGRQKTKKTKLKRTEATDDSITEELDSSDLKQEERDYDEDGSADKEEDLDDIKEEVFEHDEEKLANNTDEEEDSKCDDAELKENSDKEVKLEDSENEEENQNKMELLPGIQDFFVNDTTPQEVMDSTDDDDDEVKQEESHQKMKKKKLTATERRELARQEEEQLRKKETELADLTAEPVSEEQFDMLVTGKPNCSELWAKYIAYCVSNAEIPKARTVAKTALERIDLKEVGERYNVWIILLNLENNYGDKDSFDTVFEEAVRCNDDLQIYLDVINLLADSQKYSEMEEKIKKAKRKFRHEEKMWIEVAHVYYKCGRLKDARNLQSAAFKSIEQKTKHVSLIVQFAIMEFQQGESNYAEALFESLLQNNPKRVDIWCTYVDQAVKKGNIDGARRILERARSQSIPVKKMKTIYKRYKDLEEKHGDSESVRNVIELAREYIGSTSCIS